MEEYPEELRTPPVTLVSLVGCPELHQTISAFLHAEQPPVNTLALPDFSKISVLARKQREGADPAPAAGILKRDWLLKHRTRVPSVVAALFSTARVNGDPVQWQQVCTDLDNVKAMVRGRNIRFVVVLVQTYMMDDVSEDILTALKKRAEIDSKYLLVFAQKDASEQRQSLNRLAGIFAEQSNIYYREEARRIKTRIEKKNFSSIELAIRYCFKVAFFAEFKRDWAEALRFYEEGYHALFEMVGVSTMLPSTQRLVEIKTVAEQFHFKISTLLLHGGKVVEAITWFRKHVLSYGQLIGEPEVSFLHWEWLSRQYLVFAELLETSSAAAPSSISPLFGTLDNPLTEWEFQPAYYYQLSARYLKQKRSDLDHSLSEFTELNNSSESVVPSAFVGQFARLLEQGDTISILPLVDAEYKIYALSEGKRFQDSFEIIALFRRSYESFSSLKSMRMASYSRNRTAKEYFVLSEYGNAKQLFDGVASIYRQEGWVTLLWESLGYLRECSRQLNLQKDFVEYSLETSALPIFSSVDKKIPDDEGEYGPGGVPSLLKRQMIQEQLFELLKREPNMMPSNGSSKFSFAEDQLIHLEVDQISPLRSAFLASAAFHDQSVKPGVPTFLTLAIQSQLPNSVEIDQLEVQFNQHQCNFVIRNAQELSKTKTSVEENGPREEIVPALTLETNKWMRLTFEVKSGQSGKLECLSVTAKMGPYFSVCCRAESPASMEDLPLWKFEERVETFPTKDPGLSFSGQKVIQVEEPDPQIDLILDASGPALVGEIFVIPVVVVSRGHAVHLGELKINIVDARGGGLMSPREIEPFSDDNHHVELLSVSGIAEEDETIKDVDSIKKITRSFGLVSVPFLGIGESWSGKLEIKWHKPKSVMLYVSLGYSPSGSEASLPKVNVHKSLQIEGKIPISVSHRFMLPFRREPLLISKLKPEPDSKETAVLPLNETSILMVSARNCCEVPLRLICMSIEQDDIASMPSVSRVGGSSSEDALLVPGEEFKQVFSVTPLVEAPVAGVGAVYIEWRRDPKVKQEPKSAVLMKQKLPGVCVERPPLVVSWECPPYAVLGVPFMVYIKIQNLTSFLQEIKYSLGDSQSFVFSGSHNDSAYILPKSDHFIPYKLVPLTSGHQQLPQFTLTSVRYAVGLHPSIAASTIFIFPSEPHFNLEGIEDHKTSLPTVIPT